MSAWSQKDILSCSEKKIGLGERSGRDAGKVFSISGCKISPINKLLLYITNQHQISLLKQWFIALQVV